MQYNIEAGEIMAKNGKVIHVTDEVHAIVKAFCNRKNFNMTQWVSKILLNAVEIGKISPDKQIIDKKPIRVGPTLPPQRVEVREEDNPWIKPPFWAGKDEPTNS